MCDLHFEKHGTGALQVLLIHGWASSHRMWQAVVEQFPQLATYWLIDLPNFGASQSCQLDDATIDNYSQAVIDFLEKHKLQPDMIIAHSMGTMIALQLAATLQNKPQRLFLIAPIITGALGTGGSTGRILGSGIAGNLEPIWIRIGAALLRPPLLALLFLGTPYNKTQRQAFIQDYIEMNNIEALDVLQSIANTNLESILGNLSMPILICSGNNDNTIPISESYHAAEKIPNAKLIIFPEADHHPYIEYPKKFAALFQHFLQFGIENIEQFEGTPALTT